MPKHYPAEFRERALRLIAEIEAGGSSRTDAVGRVSSRLGASRETLRRWLMATEVNAARPGLTSEESAEIRRLRREVAELRRANEILRTASAFFAAELDRPTTK